MSEPLRVEREGAIARVMLTRSDAYNALDMDTAVALAENFVTLGADKEVRAVVLSGEGKAFCAGGDLKWVLAFAQGPDAAFHQLAARFHLAITEIRRMPKPVIAAINGVAGGGTFTLPRMVGLARALEIAAFDRPISSEQAFAWGLATKIAKDGSALPDAMTMARELAKTSLHSFGLSKQLLTDSFDSSLETQLEREETA